MLSNPHVLSSAKGDCKLKYRKSPGACVRVCALPINASQKAIQPFPSIVVKAQQTIEMQLQAAGESFSFVTMCLSMAVNPVQTVLKV